jgi:tight adherence protein B
MFLILIFALVLLLCFAVVLYFSQGGQTEAAVQRGLAKLSQGQRTIPTDATILKEEKLSPTPWVHDLLDRFQTSYKLLNLIKQASSTWWVSTLLQYSVISALVGAAFFMLAVSARVIQVFGAIGSGFLPIAYLMILRARKLNACNILLPQAVELMSRALKAGLALNSAIEMAGRDIPEPLASEFRITYEEQALGLPFRDALLNLLERLPLSDMRFLTTALLMQKDTGGNLVQILDSVVFVMKERIRIRGQIKIYTAQARLTAWIVSLMPFVMYLLINFLNPTYGALLLTDPTGRTILYSGLVSWVIGVLIIKRIVAVRV